MRFTLNVDDLPYDAMGDYSAFSVAFTKGRQGMESHTEDAPGERDAGRETQGKEQTGEEIPDDPAIYMGINGAGILFL